MTTIYGHVKDGHLGIATRKAIASFLKMLEGKPVQVEIKERKKYRSIKQNRFYFGHIVPAVREMFFQTGHVLSDEDVHDYLWRHVLKETEIVIMPNGDTYERRKSSTGFSTKDWEERIDAIRAWAAELGIALPYPNEFFDDDNQGEEK